jgi:hypothetical protein
VERYGNNTQKRGERERERLIDMAGARFSTCLPKWSEAKDDQGRGYGG